MNKLPKKSNFLEKLVPCPDCGRMVRVELHKEVVQKAIAGKSEWRLTLSKSVQTTLSEREQAQQIEAAPVITPAAA